MLVSDVCVVEELILFQGQVHTREKRTSQSKGKVRSKRSCYMLVLSKTDDVSYSSTTH